jgi:hypothetical protein
VRRISSFAYVDVEGVTTRNVQNRTLRIFDFHAVHLFGYPKAQFFTGNEQSAYGAAWGVLSVGNHPGLLDADIARFCRDLTLVFGQASLQKLEWWKARGFGANL